MLAAILIAGGAGPLEKGERAHVARVLDGDTVVMVAPVGRASEIRLVGIQAPKLPLGRKGFKKWPLADEAKSALERLTLGKRVQLSYGGRRMDRHGRLLAHLFTDGTWVQGEMLRLGLARVYSFPDNRALVAEMLAKERPARAAKRGLWAHPFYAIRGHARARRFIGSFQLVEGRVLDVAMVRGRTYLNFGANWRTDFTISLARRVGRLFKKASVDPAKMEGRQIRVRGWLKSYNGPMIEATHPEQIEVLE